MVEESKPEEPVESNEKDRRKSMDVKIKEADNIEEWQARDKTRKSIDMSKKRTSISTPEEPDLEANKASTDADGQPTDSVQKKKSRKKMKEEAKRLASLLSTNLEFKNIGFETALTKEEKVAKKKAKQEAKKAAKNAKLIASGQAVPKAKKPKKSTKKKKSVTISEETAPTTDGEEAVEVVEAAEAEKKTNKVAVEKKKEKEEVTDKKKGKKKGKKGKKVRLPPIEEEEPETMMDMLRKRASMVLEDFEQHKRQSLIMQGRVSISTTSRRLSQMDKGRRKSSQQSRNRRISSLVQLNEDSSDSTVGSDIIMIDTKDKEASKEEKGKTGKKGKKGKKEKKGTDKSKDIKAMVKKQQPTKSTATAKAKHKKSKAEFQDNRESGVQINIGSEVSIVSGGSGDDDDRKKKKLKKKQSGKKIDHEETPTAVETEKEGDKVAEEVQARRGSKVSRGSRRMSRRMSKVSKASYFRRKVSFDYDDEPLVKRDVPPMVPQLVPDVAEVPVTDEAQAGKKKGKKGKKKEVKEVPMEELSVLEQIARMKAQVEAAAAAAMQGEVVEEVPEKKKKKKKEKREKSPKGKKMTKGQRSAYNAEKQEQERLAAEAEAAALAEAERIRLNHERRMATETAKKETLEQNIRLEQLQASVDHILKYKEKKLAHEAMVKQEEEWIEYLSCGGLPDPSHCADMNTYLHLWEKELPTVDMEKAEKKTNEVLKLLKVMDLLIDAPYFDDGDKVENWKWVRGLVREQQVNNLDTATYRLLRNIALNMQRLDIPTADYRLKSDLFSLCVWLKVQLPIPIPNPRTPAPPRIKLKFPEMGMKVIFPATLDCKQMAIRAMYLKYDHLSDTCKTFDKPPIPEHFKTTLQQAVADEWYLKMLYKYNNRTKPKKKEITLDDGTTILVEPEPEPELLPGEMPPQVPYKSLTPIPEEFVLQLEEDMYKNCREALVKAVPQSVLNMREYVILGGVFYLELYYQPPQPQSMVTYELTFTTLQRPLTLQEVPFYQKYVVPDPVAAGARRSPEEIEEDLKQQEADLDKLILVNLSMPQHVIWLDVPIVVYWDSRVKVWTKKYIYDFKHIEEKNYLTFRTSVFGTFALATNKYASLPYQAWELRPEIDGTVTLQITIALLLVEFNIKDSLVSMTQLQNSPNNALQDIVGQYYKLSTLKKMLIDGGVDIFPEADAFCYIARTCEKHYPTERHMYEHMAQLAGVFNFSWSRWNLPAGRRNIVCQMREYTPGKQRQKGHSMLMVTPLRAVFIDCTEVSPVFSEVPTTDDSKLYADLYHLMKGSFKVGIRIRVNSQPTDMVNTLADLLIQTRVNSFS